jgi:hypothetical protein
MVTQSAPASLNTAHSADRGQARQTATEPPVVVVAYAPDGRHRGRWTAVLEICPACQRPHLFFGSQHGPPSGVRKCHGRTYKLFPVYGGRSYPPAVGQ